MLIRRRERALKRERVAADCVPYTAHVTDRVVRTSLLDYVQIFRLSGAGFETADDRDLNQWHERLNVLWRNIGSPHVALWSYVVRRRDIGLPGGESGPGFAARLRADYLQQLADEVLMINELYLALVHRPTAGLAPGVAARLMTRSNRDAEKWEIADALDACDKLAGTVQAALQRYEPVPLGAYTRDGRNYSAVLEFIGLLLNGEWQPIPLPRASLSGALVTTRLCFGSETIEYRMPSATRVAAMLGIKEYPTPTIVGAFNRLLSAPFPFVLTQSFAFLSRTAGQALLERQINRLANAGDFAVSQSAQLQTALDALTSNEFAMGEHHFSLQVMGEPDPAGADDARRLRTLNDSVALARSYLADTGMTVAREDLALEAAYWAQLPGNFPLRPRRAPITSRNFAAMVPMHNFPAGRARGNHWGEALATLVTTARSAYHFSLHATDPSDPDGGGRRDTGHTFICGPTGSGKTVFIGFLVSLLTQCNTTQIIFDKDQGLAILVRALGGEYLSLRNGVCTGFNPLQLPNVPGNVEFLKQWLRQLASPAGTTLTVCEQADLDQALHGTLALQPSARRLSRLLEFLDPTRPEGVHARLVPWCASAAGDYAWVFDNALDSIVSRMRGHRLIGFDVTEFLDNAVCRAPVSQYLFHLVRSLLDGRRLVCWMDEFWRLLADPAFESFAKDGPKTWRKLNAVMCLATQSASDVLRSPISRTIIEQTPTKIFFPNADADTSEYTAGFGLTEREARLVRDRLLSGDRSFLVKQGHHSIVCRLDLKRLPDALRVISGRTEAVGRMEALRASLGSDPECWLPSFLQENLHVAEDDTEDRRSGS